ncbi:MAG: hypothetical protein VKO64_11095 [Candidatus Sericytochromatia bacterium]|nr:hypothetical protein [Candidatus Sericytochromatia bacterium]
MSLQNISSQVSTTQRLAPLSGAAKDLVDSLAKDTAGSADPSIVKDFMDTTQGGVGSTLQLEVNNRSGSSRRG